MPQFDECKGIYFNTLLFVLPLSVTDMDGSQTACSESIVSAGGDRYFSKTQAFFEPHCPHAEKTNIEITVNFPKSSTYID